MVTGTCLTCSSATIVQVVTGTCSVIVAGTCLRMVWDSYTVQFTFSTTVFGHHTFFSHKVGGHWTRQPLTQTVLPGMQVCCTLHSPHSRVTCLVSVLGTQTCSQTSRYCVSETVWQTVLHTVFIVVVWTGRQTV